MYNSYKRLVERAEIIKREDSTLTFRPTQNFKYAFNSVLYIKLPELIILPQYKDIISCRWIYDVGLCMIKSATYWGSTTEHTDGVFMQVYNAINDGPKFCRNEYDTHHKSITSYIQQLWSYCLEPIHSIGGTGIHEYVFDFDLSKLISVRKHIGDEYMLIPFDQTYFELIAPLSDPELMIFYAMPELKTVPALKYMDIST